MRNIHEIEEAVRTLSSDDLAAFRVWFADYDAEKWDRKLENDVSNGRLDELADEALKEMQEGRCTDL
jgi:hypothetical protein